MATRNASLLTRMAFAVAAGLIVSLFYLLGNQDKGVIAAFSFGAIAGVAKVKWKFIRHFWFLGFLAAVIALHSAAVFLFSGRIDVHPTIMLAPFAFLDALIMLLVARFLEQRFT